MSEVGRRREGREGRFSKVWLLVVGGQKEKAGKRKEGRGFNEEAFRESIALQARTCAFPLNS